MATHILVCDSLPLLYTLMSKHVTYTLMSKHVTICRQQEKEKDALQLCYKSSLLDTAFHPRYTAVQTSCGKMMYNL
jgi:hypothetical protein